jgi:hypothetical protein
LPEFAPSFFIKLEREMSILKRLVVFTQLVRRVYVAECSTASPRLGGRKLKSFVAAGLAALTLATIADTASAMISGECSSQYFVARYSADVGSYYYYTAVRATAYQYGSNSTLSSPWRIFFPGERLDRLEYIPIPPGTGYWAEALEAYWWDGSQWIFAANLWVPVGSGLYGYYCLF